MTEHITLGEAARLAPSKPSTNSVWRWCRQGVRSASGTVVRLKHVRSGRQLFTSKKWLNRFLRDLAEADSDRWKNPPKRKKRQPKTNLKRVSLTREARLRLANDRLETEGA